MSFTATIAMSQVQAFPNSPLMMNDFCFGRLAGHLSSKWLSKMVHLYDEDNGQQGKLVAVMPAAEASLTAEDIESMKQVPGVWEAYEGINKLQLEVMVH